jgi:mRNA interferase RelE/StbE
MELLRSIRFERSYAKAPQQVQHAFDKQSLLLLQNLHHPSLRAKKYDESQGLWQARAEQELAVLLPDSG